MAEIREGLRNVLSNPAVYDAFQRGVGAYAWHKRVLSRFAQSNLSPGAAVLDIGCGTGDVVAYLPSHITYHGFDRNAAYIAKAQRRFPQGNASFHCEEFDGQLNFRETKFDLVLAIGLIHHLDDNEVLGLMRGVKNVLGANGMFMALDPVKTPEQSSIARFLVSNDRGRNVRTPEQYLSLAQTAFASAEGIVDDNPMYIPYTGYILRCRN